MISRRIWFGIPLGRRSNRRWLVAGYWAVSVAVLGSLWSPAMNLLMMHGFWPPLLIGLTYGSLAVFLGGTSGIGPVSSFDGDFSSWSKWSLVGALDTIICKVRGAEPDTSESLLDERDIRLRNAAHYEAYRIVMRIILPLGVALGFAFATIWSRYKLFAVPVFGVAFLVLLNLPQTLILWWEPDVDEAGTRGKGIGNRTQPGGAE
jgi:hypothetical protein